MAGKKKSTLHGSRKYTQAVKSDLGKKVSWTGYPLQAGSDKKIKEFEERYRAIFEASTDAVFLETLDGRILDCNTAACTAHGYSKDELIGLYVKDLVPEEIARTLPDVITEHLTTGGIFVEAAGKRKDGSVFPTEVSTKLISFEEEKMVVVFVRDITDRKKAEEQLRQSNEKYRSLVDSVSIGIALVDKDMRILSINNHMKKMFPEIDITRHPLCYEIIGSDQQNSICSDCSIAQTLEDGKVHESIVTRNVHIGTRNFRIVSSPIKDKDGSISAAIEMIEDVTDKLRMEEELLKSEKLESVGLLAGGIAHDFNNILTVILGNISLTKPEVEQNSELFQQLHSAEQATMRAKDLTQQLLTFAKGGTPVKETTSIAEIIRESTGFALRGSNVLCEFILPDDLYNADVDRGQISQVIHNLVMNADQAMPAGGVIKINARNLRLSANNPWSIKSGNYVIISVIDSGIGIPDEYIQKVFDPYFTTKSKGSGLGLATSYAIIKNHGGSLFAKSQVGSGTTFNIYLPASEKILESEEDNEILFMKGAGKILVIDDEAAVRRVAVMMLKNLGYEPETAIDGEEGIEIYKKTMKTDNPFTAVIIDLTIPGGMDGKTAVKQLKQIDPNVKAIVSSGYSNDPVMASFKDYGFMGRVAKPYQLIDLAKTLNKVLQNEL